MTDEASFRNELYTPEKSFDPGKEMIPGKGKGEGVSERET